MRAGPSHTFSVTSHPPLRTLTVPPSYTSVLWQDAVATGGGSRRRGDVRWAGTDRSSTHHPTRPRSFAGAPPRPVHMCPIIHGAHTMHAQCLHRAYTVHTCSEYTVRERGRDNIYRVYARPGKGSPLRPSPGRRPCTRPSLCRLCAAAATWRALRQIRTAAWARSPQGAALQRGPACRQWRWQWLAAAAAVVGRCRVPTC